MFKKQSIPTEYSDTDQSTVEETTVTNTYYSYSEPESVPDQDVFENMCTAKNEFTKGNISLDEYKNIF